MEYRVCKFSITSTYRMVKSKGSPANQRHDRTDGQANAITRHDTTRHFSHPPSACSVVNFTGGFPVKGFRCGVAVLGLRSGVVGVEGDNVCCWGRVPENVAWEREGVSGWCETREVGGGLGDWAV